MLGVRTMACPAHESARAWCSSEMMNRTFLGFMQTPSIERKRVLLHDRGPARDLAREEFLQIFRRAPFRRDEIAADSLHLLLDGRGVERRERGRMELAHDRIRRRP